MAYRPTPWTFVWGVVLAISVGVLIALVLIALFGRYLA